MLSREVHKLNGTLSKALVHKKTDSVPQEFSLGEERLDRQRFGGLEKFNTEMRVRSKASRTNPKIDFSSNQLHKGRRLEAESKQIHTPQMLSKHDEKYNTIAQFDKPQLSKTPTHDYIVNGERGDLVLGAYIARKKISGIKNEQAHQKLLKADISYDCDIIISVGEALVQKRNWSRNSMPGCNASLNQDPDSEFIYFYEIKKKCINDLDQTDIITQEQNRIKESSNPGETGLRIAGSRNNGTEVGSPLGEKYFEEDCRDNEKTKFVEHFAGTADDLSKKVNIDEMRCINEVRQPDCGDKLNWQYSINASIENAILLDADEGKFEELKIFKPHALTIPKNESDPQGVLLRSHPAIMLNTFAGSSLLFDFSHGRHQMRSIQFVVPPIDAGSVRIAFQKMSERVRFSIFTGDAEILELMRQNANLLIKDLLDYGFFTVTITFTQEGLSCFGTKSDPFSSENSVGICHKGSGNPAFFGLIQHEQEIDLRL